MTKEIYDFPRYLEYVNSEVQRRDGSGGSKIFFDISIKFMEPNMADMLKIVLERQDFFTEIEITTCPLGLSDVILYW